MFLYLPTVLPTGTRMYAKPRDIWKKYCVFLFKAPVLNLNSIASKSGTIVTIPSKLISAGLKSFIVTVNSEPS